MGWDYVGFSFDNISWLIWLVMLVVQSFPVPMNPASQSIDSAWSPMPMPVATIICYEHPHFLIWQIVHRFGLKSHAFPGAERRHCSLPEVSLAGGLYPDRNPRQGIDPNVSTEDWSDDVRIGRMILDIAWFHILFQVSDFFYLPISFSFCCCSNIKNILNDAIIDDACRWLAHFFSRKYELDKNHRRSIRKPPAIGSPGDGDGETLQITARFSGDPQTFIALPKGANMVGIIAPFPLSFWVSLAKPPYFFSTRVTFPGNIPEIYRPMNNALLFQKWPV